jgi:palmitoyltransferase ZDHHC3/7/25
MTGRSDICCGRFGTSFEAKRWLSLDPCGLVCITFSFSVHGFALAVIALFLIQHSVVSRSIFYAVYCPAAFMALWSLHTAWTTNPGAVPFGARPLTTVKKAGGGQKQRSIRRCAKCNDNYKPPRAHHDSVTGRCIVKMDHYWYVCD